MAALAAAGRRADHRRRARPALLRASASASTRPGSAEAAAAAGLPRHRHRALARPARVPGLPRRRRRRRPRRRCPPRTEVVFTAHRLPERVLAGDPYPDELRTSAEAVADRSACAAAASSTARLGRRRPLVDRPGRAPAPPPSRGAAPTSSRSSATAAPPARVDGILVCPQGFVADHLEVAYDLDIEAPTRGRRGRHRLRPHPRRSTTTPPCSPPSPTASPPRADRPRRPTGRDRRPARPRRGGGRRHHRAGGGVPAVAGRGATSRWSSPTGSAASSRPRWSPAGRSTRRPTPSCSGCRGRSPCATTWSSTAS